MSKDEKIKQIAEKAAPVFEKYGIKYAGLFGSYARGNEREGSDIDILVRRGNKSLSLFDFFDMKDEISDALNKKVDLVSEKAVIPYFKDHIFNDLKVIYGER
ncbi:MAG: nucleotidyltransferase family protein [bacterium]|nr:nucleotidyltransferase family protein [bacterium]